MVEYLFEPFLDLSNYFLEFYEYQKQLLSFIIWIFFIVFISGIIKLIQSNKTNNFEEILSFIILIIYRFSLIFLIFILFIIYTVFTPFNKIKLHPLINKINTDNYFIVDFHTHSFFSHDGIVSPEQNIIFHKKYNFNGIFFTDHNINEVNLIKKFTKKYNFYVFNGEEIQDKNNNALLILGCTTTLYLKSKNTEEIIKNVHKLGGIVIIAHWWQQKGFELEYFKKCNIDGFEVFGHTRKHLTIDDRLKLLKFCKENNFIMLNGSNWHGWGYKNDLWTLVKIENWHKYNDEFLEKKIIEFIKNKKTHKFINITLFDYSDNYYIYNNLTGFVFEPFLGIYKCLREFNIHKIISYFFWIFILFFSIKKYYKLNSRYKKTIKFIFNFLIFVIFLSFSLKFYFLWKNIYQYNKILLEISKTFLVISLFFSIVSLLLNFLKNRYYLK